MIGELAVQFGSRPPPFERRNVSPRSLAALAADNVVEGCVREAYGALVAAHQASFARDAQVRAVFETIARDEARHALLSFRIHDWASTKIADAESLEHERRTALAELAASVRAPTEAERTELGLHDAERSAALIAALAA
jgi:hypothetical protein